MINNNNRLLYSAFCHRIQSAAAYYILRYQENRHSHFASPKGATGQVQNLSALRL